MRNLATMMMMKKTIMNLHQSPPSLKQRSKSPPWCPHRTAWRVQARVGEEEVALGSPPNRRAFRIPMATFQPPQPHLWWHPRRQKKKKRQARRPRRSRRTSTSFSRTKICPTWTSQLQMEATTAPTAPMVPTAPSLLQQRLDNNRYPKPQESRQATKKKGSMDTNTEVIGIEIGTRRVAKERKEGTGTETRKAARPRRVAKGGNIDTGRKRMPSLAIVNILGSKLMS